VLCSHQTVMVLAERWWSFSLIVESVVPSDTHDFVAASSNVSPAFFTIACRRS